MVAGVHIGELERNIYENLAFQVGFAETRITFPYTYVLS